MMMDLSDHDSATVNNQRRKNQRRQRSNSSSIPTADSKFKDYEQETEMKTKIDNAGLCCPICMDPWTSQGLHQVCCLPCGHVYGLSCISKWIEQCGKKSKCPQCNVPCKQKDVRKIYATPVYLVDEDLPKKVESFKVEVGAPCECENVGPVKVEAGSRVVEDDNNMRHGRVEYIHPHSTARIESQAVRKIDGGMVTFMHVFMAVLSLVICAAIYISLRHSVLMFVVTIVMFLGAVGMFVMDELLK